MKKSELRIRPWLLPFAWLYGIGANIRNWLFETGKLKEKAYNVPVICVGNLTVGGTGKTPHTEYLVQLLKDRFQVAVLSRGYKRNSNGFIESNEYTTVKTIGDEPWQMKKKFPEVTVAVDKDRCHGIEKLLRKERKPDVFILDDAFQHRYVKAGENILLIDYNRMILKDKLLPAGSLREPIGAKDRATTVIITKCPKNLSPMDYRIITKDLNLYAYQKLFFTTLTYRDLYSITQPQAKYEFNCLRKDVHIIAIAGIASPQPFFNHLSERSKNIHKFTFDDHHTFTSNDLKKINQAFMKLPEGKRIVITTEKDAARLLHCTQFLKYPFAQYTFAQPIEVEFLQDKQDEFNEIIINYVTKDYRNLRFY